MAIASSNRIKFIRPIGLIDVTAIACLLGLLLAQIGGFAGDPGVGWHLKSGEWIATHGVVPKVDPFLAWSEPRAWVCDQWLSDLIFYFLYSHGSWPLLYAALSSFYLATYLLLLYPGVRKLTGSAMASVFGVFFAWKVGLVHFILRPVLLSFMFFSWVYLRVLDIYRTAHLQQKHLRVADYLMFPLVFILWANLHPSFVMGLVLLALVPCSMVLDLFLLPDRASANWTLIRRITILVLLCVVVTAINPNGFNLHASILELGQNKYFMRLHVEWLSPDFQQLAPRFLYAAVMLLVFSALWGTKPNWRSFELLMLTTFLFLTLNAIRILPFMGIVMAVPFAESLLGLKGSALWRLGPLLGAIPQRFANLERREQRSYGARWVGVALLAFIAWCYSTQSVPFVKSKLGPPESYPYAAVEFLKNHNASERDVVVFADPGWGGFIAMFGAPNLRAAFDDRNTLLGQPLYEQYFAAMKVHANWRGFLRQFGTSFLLLRAKSDFAIGLKYQGIQPVFSDEVAMVFDVRREMVN